MKNYSEIFDQTYYEVFKQNRRKMNAKESIIYLLYFFTFCIICYCLIKIGYTDLGIGYIICLSLVIGGLIAKFVVKVDTSSDIYEIKAKEFATTTYLDAIIITLSTKFSLDPTFKENLKQDMMDFIWYDNENETFDPGWKSDKGFFKEKIRLDNEDYYLVGWKDTNEGFLFQCKKAITKEQLESVEFLLAAPEK